MKAYEVLNKSIDKRGIPIAELARRVGMNAELLRRSLSGERKLNVDEFLPLCVELDLGINDFSPTAAA